MNTILTALGRRATLTATTLLIAVFSILIASDASASHYRGAAASYTIDANGVVTVTAYTGWESSQLPSFSIYTGSGATGGSLGLMTNTASVDPFDSGTELGGSGYVIRKDTFTFNLNGQSAGFYYAWWSSGCYVGGINNLSGACNWSVELKIAYTPGVATAGPTMIPATIDQATRGFQYTQNLNSIDPDGTPVTYTNLSGYVAPDYAPTSLIPGISVSATGTVSISPAGTTALALGRWGYKIRVTDGSGGTAIRDTLLVVVDNPGGTPNQQPVLASIGPKSVAVNGTLSFPVSATDPDTGQNITVRAKLLPSGSTCPDVTGPTTGTSTTFNWTPGPGSEGSYVVVFEVFDNAGAVLTDSEEVTITVTGDNNPPVLAAVGNQSVANGGNLTFNLSATDPDDDGVMYQMFNGPPGATLTSGGAFSWSPSAGQSNTTFTGITLRATDDGDPNLSDSESITITVGAGNNAPLTSTASLNLNASVGQNVSFLVTGTDVDTAQTLALTANAGVPSGATFPGASGTSPISSTFSWTPTALQTGLTTVKFLTQDNGTPVLNHEITVTINVTAGPVVPTVTTPAATAITVNSGTLGGNVTGDGGATITARGVVYSKTSDDPTPTIGEPNVTNATTTGTTGVFTVNVMGLAPGTPYSYAAYATNSEGTTYTTPVATFTTLAPEIAISGNGNPITDGDTMPSLTNHTDFGNVEACTGSLTRTFTIANSGTAALNLTGGPPRVTLTGPATFSLALDATTPVSSSGGTTTFQVKYTPAAVGAQSATVSIANDDSNENPYNFSIQGTGVDTTKPVITLTGSAAPTLECPAPYMEPGATVSDACDLTVTVDIGGDTVDATTPGVYTVTYDATDASGNAAVQVKRVVTVQDTTKPVITLTGSAAPTLECPAPYVEAGATVSDTCDLTVTVDIGGDTVDATTPGVYTVTYNAADASGNAAVQVTRVVTIQDTTPPVIDPASVPDDIAIQAAEGMSSATATWTDPTATDACDPAPVVSCSTASGSSFPLGSTLVTCTATDAEGNSSEVCFLVHIDQPPRAVNEIEVPMAIAALNGEAVPAAETMAMGGSLPDDATLNTFVLPVINDSDEVAFDSTIKGTGVSGANNSVLWTDAGGALRMVAHEGDTTPSGSTYKRFNSSALTDDGVTGFHARADAAAAADQGVYLDDGMTVAGLGREGNAAAGTGATFRVVRSGVFGSAGKFAFGALLLQDGVNATGATDSGIWSNVGGPLGPIAREGDLIAAIPGTVYGHLNTFPVMNESDELAVSTYLALGPGGVTSANNHALLSGVPGAFGVVSREGDPAPLADLARISYANTMALNQAGEVAFVGLLSTGGGSPVTSVNNSAVFTNAGGMLVSLAREGEQPPGTGVGTEFRSFIQLDLATNGRVTVRGTVRGAGVDRTNDSAIWQTVLGKLTLAMREGDPAPGTDGAEISTINRMTTNEDGNILILARMTRGVGDATRTNNLGLWVSTAESERPQLIVRAGDTFDLGMADIRKIISISVARTNIAGSGDTGGVPRAMNAATKVVVVLKFTRGSGVFVIEPSVPD